MPVRRIMVGYWVWMAVLSAAFLVRPLEPGVIALAGVSAVVALVYGVRRYRPTRVWAWLSLAGTVALSAAAWALYILLPGPAGSLKPGIWFVYGLLLIMSLIMIGGLLGLGRPEDRDLTAGIDVAVLLLGAGLLAGVLIAVPYAITPDLPTGEAVVRVLFVARDVLVLAAVVHFGTSERWTSPVALLVTGTLGFLCYDALVRLGFIRGVSLVGTPIALGWLFFAAAWGAAGLLPAMAGVGAPGAPDRHRSTLARLGLMAGASVLPFALLLALMIEPGHRPYEVVLVLTSMAVLVLVLAQLIRVALQLRNQVAGERMLRQAVADVATAPDTAAIASALEADVPELLPTRTGANLRVLASTGTGQPTPNENGVPPAGMPSPVAGLPAAMARRLGDDHVLGYSLGPHDAAGPEARLELYVGGRRSALARVQPRLDVLAAQAGLALDRLRLGREVVRRATEEYVRALAQTSGDIILIVDDEDRITLASPSVDSIFGTSNLAGRWLPGLVDEAGRPAVLDLLNRTRAGETCLPRRGLAKADAGAHGGAVAPGDPLPSVAAAESTEGINVADWSVPRGDGSLARIEVACRCVKATDPPSVHGLVVDLRDVSDQRRLEGELIERAMHDSLTGLASRPLFRDCLRQAVETSASHHCLTGVVFLDMDDFKLINNQLGHELGDTVLRTVGRRLAESLPPGGTAARLGGDEFGVVVPDVATPGAVDEFGARILAAIADPISVADHVVTCSASLGIATTEDANTESDLSCCADLSLHCAKTAGRGLARHYEATMRSAVLDRLELRSSLESALVDRALALEYQPIVDLATGSTVGLEALLRWRHPTRGWLAPGAFIDVAEESGLIIPIGDWILATALREARRWERVAPGVPPYVSVNVSPLQLGSPGFFVRTRRQLAESGLPASRLHLEITESLLLSDDDRMWNELQRLRRLGVQIAIDDFGTGYSALSYLGHVPVDLVKLDRTFVSPMTTSDQQRELVKGIVRLAKILKLWVVAEGIETVDERDVVAKVGCRYGQGYLFARPMSADAALGWLANEEAARVR